jgi:hypothetical protein
MQLQQRRITYIPYSEIPEQKFRDVDDSRDVFERETLGFMFIPPTKEC